MEEKMYLIWLSEHKGISLDKKYHLLGYFGSAKEIYQSKKRDLVNSKILTSEQVESIEHKIVVDEKILESYKGSNVGVIDFRDNDYPEFLSQIYLPPMVLYYKGTCNTKMFKKTFGIVGARNATFSGKLNTEKIAADLASSGITVVSGLAKGIDAAAHKGALASGGITTAVLGSGVDICYPRENMKIYESIIRDGGCIFSEFPMGTPPLPMNFPRRNRIISGISIGLMVAEAEVKSGSLISAGFALEQGREVYALPGDINRKNSLGTNLLIRDGAKMVLKSSDIIEDIVPMFDTRQMKQDKNNVDIDEKENEIMDLVRKGWDTVEMIGEKSDFSLSEINYILTKLEIKQIITINRGRCHILV
ncbi:DNA-processing protein DprA [Alkalibacter mobilis]|uniref:DNA-processing protein DprA n=1 Tax=Alkalibacter mobilis TaxID=2787712 RepID=UPI00189FC312|nr:DNA-processing protein DprA [Alkalibacter mobilis]MBF7095821.1 DNA-protecting protein DprA [Alkalibacter mobilis]